MIYFLVFIQLQFCSIFLDMNRRKGLTTKEALALFENLPSDNSDTPIESSSDEEVSIDDPPSPSGSHTVQNSAEDKDETISDEEEDPEQVSRVWRKKTLKTTIPIFSLNSGFIHSFFDNLSTPTDYFLQYFDQEIVDKVIFQTNLYITQKQKKLHQSLKKSCMDFWDWNSYLVITDFLEYVITGRVM